MTWNLCGHPRDYIRKVAKEVTKVRFPEMEHFGDITKLKGSELPPVDIITGGSPCQDLSIASGNRKGLQGERSGLFMDQVRIVREMRESDRKRGRTNESLRPKIKSHGLGKDPVAFSSAEGEVFDFSGQTWSNLSELTIPNVMCKK